MEIFDLKNNVSFYQETEQKVKFEEITMKVEPIRSQRDLAKIRRLLKDKPRDLLLLNLGVNTGLRVQDILSLRVKQVRNVPLGGRIVVKEKKTQKQNIIIVNKLIFASLNAYFEAFPEVRDEDFVFKSRKGRNYPLTTYAVTQMVQRWCDSIGLKINAGAHSLRKTFCWMQRTVYGTSWEQICERLNHSSPAITRRYLGIKKEEIEQALMHDI